MDTWRKEAEISKDTHVHINVYICSYRYSPHIVLEIRWNVNVVFFSATGKGSTMGCLNCYNSANVVLPLKLALTYIEVS